MKTTETEKKTTGVTAKTLGAWTGQGRRIINENLLSKEDAEKLLELQEKVKEMWIKKLF